MTAAPSSPPPGRSPRWPGEPLLARPALLERLDGLLDHPLTLVTGAAASGKTVLVRQWCEQRCPLPIAWRDVPRHADPAAAVLAELAAALSSLGGPGRVPTDRLATWADGDRLTGAALDELTAALSDTPPGVVVLDGLTWPAPVPVLAEVGTALARADRCGLHLLATSRAEPHLNLAALLYRGEALHLGASELRLSPGETASLLELLTGEGPSDEDAIQPTRGVDGWIAGAVMAAANWPGPTNETAAKRVETALLASAAHLTGFFYAEVLPELTSDQLDLLTSTAPLRRLSGRLCDTVLHRQGSGALLRGLQEGGLFVSRDAQDRGWFQVHPGLRALLAAQLERDDPGRREPLLAEAAAWLADEGRSFDAARYRIKLHDWDAAFALLTASLPATLAADEIDRLSEMVGPAPSTTVTRHTNWLLAILYVLQQSGDIQQMFQLLSIFEGGLSDEHAGRVRAALQRATTLEWLADARYCLTAAEDSLRANAELRSEAATPIGYGTIRPAHLRLQARSIATLAAAFLGDWERATHHFAPLELHTTTDLQPVFLLPVLGRRALYLALLGHTEAARAEAEAALAAADAARLDGNRNVAHAHAALAEVHRLQGRPDEAARCYELALPHAEVNQRINLVALLAAGHARALLDLRRPEQARNVLDRARARLGRHVPPVAITGSLAAAEAHTLLTLADPSAARDVLQTAPTTSEIAELRVAESLLRSDFSTARAALSTWPESDSTVGELRRHLAGVAAFEASRGGRQADRLFAQAMDLAVRHRLVQPFTAFGPLLQRQLRRAATEPGSRGEIAAAALGLLGDTTAAVIDLTPQQALILSHLHRPLTLPELARELNLSVNTVRSHVKAIYRKLGVSSRQAAVERAGA